jgi:F0F1-type ATP synthase alpha subunit
VRRVPVKEIQRYMSELAEYMKAQKGDFLKALRDKKELTSELTQQLEKALAEFKGVFQSEPAQD